MKRRAYLATAGSGALAVLAGCSALLGGGSSSLNHAGTLDAEFAANVDLPADDDPSDGYPPQYGNPGDRSIDESRFSALSVNGETVTLVPIEVSHYWHQTAAARFVDARGLDQYKTSHVYGAVNSPAVRNSQGGGIDNWPKGDRIVCYCGCPHHLSSIRAAGLQKAGYSNVYVIDEGFFEWRDRGFPMRGTSFEAAAKRVIEGEVAAAYAGEYAWATQPETGQQEAARIREDGSFEIHLRFAGLTAETPIRVATPAFEVTRPLGELVDGVVTA
ncbi:MAG: rhodanese-like domain-containing protein [Halobacterium sp.]